MKPKIAVIGAGVGGLALARQLAQDGDVVVFEKARGVGGRMATRYADPFFFDHGAQCFTARSKAFQGFVKPLIEEGVIAEWKGKVINLEVGKKTTKRLWFEVHLVASPNMNSLCKHLSGGVDIRLSTEVAPLGTRKEDGWHLTDKEGKPLGVFDWVISTAPPAQTAALFGKSLPKTTPLANSTLSGCYALMLGFNRTWDQSWIAAKVRNNPLKWISVNSTKPGRNPDVTCLVAHSRGSWADEHMDMDMNEAEALLLAEFSNVTGMDAKAAVFKALHRWRYAIVEDTQKSGPYLDIDHGLAAVSDWSATSRIEEVWLMAMDLARDMKIAMLTQMSHKLSSRA